MSVGQNLILLKKILSRPQRIWADMSAFLLMSINSTEFYKDYHIWKVFAFSKWYYKCELKLNKSAAETTTTRLRYEKSRAKERGKEVDLGSVHIRASTIRAK